MARTRREQWPLAALGRARHDAPMTLSPALMILPALFVLIMLAELWVPARAAARARWPLNLTLGTVNLLLGRLLAAAGPVAAAAWAAQQGWGLLNLIDAPGWAAILITIILLDLAIYGQHRAFHSFSWGWALHRLHHADGDFDVTTGVRFHPGEALVSLAYKSACVLLLGAPVLGVLLFELYLGAGSMIEHANLRLPRRADAVIRRIWVTPDMHRIHHSAHGADHNHNYGFAIAIWDHLFGSYRDEAAGPNIGLPQRDAAG
jgi:sterol desaturase/sphingolipid hydroxylase (fatty acid hydroxylase superfamily)